MKPLFDQNLSDRLVRNLSNLWPESAHIKNVGLEQAPDRVVWEHAKSEGYTIVTQDSDFEHFVRLEGHPPKVIWLRCGNTATANIERLLRASADLIADFMDDPDVGCIELF